MALLWGVFDAWVPSQADLSRVLGFLLGLMALVATYTWTRLSDTKASIDDFRKEIASLVDRIGSLTDSLDSRRESLTLREAFDLAYLRCPSVDKVRIYAVTSQVIQQNLFAHDFRIGSCEVLIFEPTVGEREALRDSINSVVRDWKDRYVRRGIGILEVRRYSDFPTEFTVIFDDRLAICGMYINEPVDRTGVRYSKVSFLGALGGANRSVIQDHIDKFDGLFGLARKEFSSSDRPSLTSISAESAKDAVQG
ncbi:hypothetical protein OHA01_24695 [Micromonospora zamorensis]|uniref:hypothetical protein n=1 Tax=Micromonospora zamorensis TaxID=709883 RepID=UPI003863B328|nr:hypothetical protein OHA01_24695 [Micromonospora zamorensis]